MNHWIFTITGSGETFDERVAAKKWPINSRTPNRKSISAGDSIVFYKARENGQKFLGSATIQEIVSHEDDSAHYVEMSVIRAWDKPVEMKDVLSDLEFIKNKKAWGNYFQGGIIKIPEKDYLEIINRK